MNLEQEIKNATVRLMVAMVLLGVVLCGSAWALVTYQDNLYLTFGVVAGIAFVENRILNSRVKRLNELKALDGVDSEDKESEA